VSDGAQYILKTGKLLKERYTNMSHVAYIAHALNRICEFIRNKFPDVDKLISTCKFFLLKSSQSVALYKELCPHFPLPPQPVHKKYFC
jgi:hypothetical protein